MCKDEEKPKNGSNSEETINEKIPGEERENILAQTKDQSETKLIDKSTSKTDDPPGEEDKSVNVTKVKISEVDSQCESPVPTQKSDKVLEVRDNNNSSNLRTYSRAINTGKGRPIFESGSFGPKRPNLRIIRNKMISNNDWKWVNKNNCAINFFQGGNQLKGERKTRLQKGIAPQRPPAMNAFSTWKPLEKGYSKNKRSVYLDNTSVNNPKMTEDFAANASKHFNNHENASQNVQKCKTDSTEKRCSRRTNAWALDPSVNDNSQFINSYPSIYVSQAGLINIFLRWGIILEVTADKVLRLVDRRQNMAIATSRKGKMCSIHHPSAKIFQNEKSADAELCGRWQVRRRKNHVLVADRTHSVWIDDTENYGTVEYKKHQFVDMTYDNTVNLPCSSPTYGPWAIPHCMNLVTSARFGRTRNSSLFVHLNDIHITQKQCGDVIVRTDTVVLRMRPKFGSIEVETRDADIVTALGKEIRCYFKEALTFTTSRQGLTLSNGKVEASLLNTGRIEFHKLPGRIPLPY